MVAGDPGGFSVAKVVVPRYETIAPGKVVYFKVGIFITRGGCFSVPDRRPPARCHQIYVKPTENRPFFVSKRFSQFVELDKQIRMGMPLVDLPSLPAKRPRYIW